MKLLTHFIRRVRVDMAAQVQIQVSEVVKDPTRTTQILDPVRYKVTSMTIILVHLLSNQKQDSTMAIRHAHAVGKVRMKNAVGNE